MRYNKCHCNFFYIASDSVHSNSFNLYTQKPNYLSASANPCNVFTCRIPPNPLFLLHLMIMRRVTDFKSTYHTVNFRQQIQLIWKHAVSNTM